jgi:hypothetical protein
MLDNKIHMHETNMQTSQPTLVGIVLGVIPRERDNLTMAATIKKHLDEQGKIKKIPTDAICIDARARTEYAKNQGGRCYHILVEREFKDTVIKLLYECEALKIKPTPKFGDMYFVATEEWTECRELVKSITLWKPNASRAIYGQIHNRVSQNHTPPRAAKRNKLNEKTEVFPIIFSLVHRLSRRTTKSKRRKPHRINDNPETEKEVTTGT